MFRTVVASCDGEELKVRRRRRGTSLRIRYLTQLQPQYNSTPARVCARATGNPIRTLAASGLHPVPDLSVMLLLLYSRPRTVPRSRLKIPS